MAKRRFNPEGIKPYSNFLMDLLGKYALADYEQERKQANTQKMLEALGLNKGGLFGGTETPTADEFAPRKMSQGYVSGIDLESDIPKLSMYSPEEQRTSKIQDDIRRLKLAEAEKAQGQGMTKGQFTAMAPGSRAEFIKARMSQSPQAFAALKQLRPLYGEGARYKMGC